MFNIFRPSYPQPLSQCVPWVEQTGTVDDALQFLIQHRDSTWSKIIDVLTFWGKVVNLSWSLRLKEIGDVGLAGSALDCQSLGSAPCRDILSLCSTAASSCAILKAHCYVPEAVNNKTNSSYYSFQQFNQQIKQ